MGGHLNMHKAEGAAPQKRAVSKEEMTEAPRGTGKHGWSVTVWVCGWHALLPAPLSLWRSLWCGWTQTLHISWVFIPQLVPPPCFNLPHPTLQWLGGHCWSCVSQIPCLSTGTWDILHPDGLSGWPFTDLCLNTWDWRVTSHPHLGWC